MRLVFRSNEPAFEERSHDVAGAAVNQRLRRDQQRQGDEQSNLRVEVFEERLADAIDRPALDERDDEEGHPRHADDDEEITPQSGAQKRVTPLLK